MVVDLSLTGKIWNVSTYIQQHGFKGKIHFPIFVLKLSLLLNVEIKNSKQ